MVLERSGIESDFYVRDMLTRSLARQPVSTTIPLLVAATKSDAPQTPSQALHTLSKMP